MSSLIMQINFTSTPLRFPQAFIFIAAATGPFLGFALSSSSLSQFVDFDRVPVEDRPAISQSDPRFIGAWWLGFICIGASLTALSVPFFFFPRYLPKSKERLKEEEEGARQQEKVSERIGQKGIERVKHSLSLEVG